MRIAAVVVHYRFWPELSACIDSLAAQSHPLVSVTLVDDASMDGSVAAIRDSYPWVRLLEQPRNAGYAAAVNAGIAASPDVDAVLVVSHETVLKSDALECMAEAMSVDGVGVVGPILGLLDSPGRTWSAGGGIGRRSSLPFHLQQPAAAVPYEVAWVDGAAFLVDRSAWLAVDGLDETYFLYVEEMDFMQRLAGAGWSVQVAPRAMGWQRPGMTPPYLEARNMALWLFRSRRFVQLAFHISRQFYLAACEAWVRHTRWRAVARLRGLRDATRGHLDRVWALRRSAPPR